MSNEGNLDGVTVIGIDIGKDVFHLVGFASQDFGEMFSGLMLFGAA